MKKLSFMAMSALLVLGVASCKKNSDVQNPESKEGMVKMVFSAVSNESKEKTSISGSDILWSEGDIVKIYAGSSTTGNDFTLTEGDGTTSATFEGWIAETATAPYYAVYPSSAAQGIDGSAIKYSIPAEQAYVENSFATGTVPMVAYSEADKSLAFKNQTAFIKLQLTGAGTIETMTLESASNNICGTFNVSKTDPTASSTAVEEAKKITITNISGTALDGTTPKNVIIAVAPATFATDDITLSMTDSDGKVFSTKIGNFNVERSGGHAVAVEVEFETPAPATTGEAEITGGTKVKWIQLWENGPKWAEYNVGATSVGDYGGYYCWGSSENKGSAYPKVTIMIQGTEYDTAKNLWGSNWQMATQEDFGNLIANCDVQWTDNYNGTGKAGRVYTGKSEGYTENSVFFPAAGYYSSSEVKDGDKGNYWTDVSLNKNTSYRFLFDNSTASEAKSFGRGNCLSVRAILKE